MIGKWESATYENIDEFWNVMGVPEELRQAARQLKTCLEIARADGGAWKLVTTMGDKSRTVIFPVGQEVDTISLMREPIKAVLTEEDGCLVEKQKCSQGEITIRRSLVDGNLATEMTLKGVKAVIRFTKG